MNKLTREQTDRVINTDEKEMPSAPAKDVLEALNLARALDMSMRRIKQNPQIDIPFIMDIHKEILSNLDDNNAGFYRNCNARPMGFCNGYPNYMKIPDKMDNLIKFINNTNLSTFEKAIEVHYRLVEIHPFIDGNGRTARLLMNIILMNNGVIPIFIKPETRSEYIDKLDNYRVNGAREEYRHFMSTAFYDSMYIVCDFLHKNRIR